MSVVTYGKCRMQIMKTEHFGFGPRYTEDGVDYLYTELDMAVTAVVNPMALATNGPGNIASRNAGQFLEDAPAQAGGDALGITLANLRAILLTPRQTLTFSIVAPNGQNNQVFSISGPDSKNGPLPQRDTYVRWIMGTNTALVFFHVKAWTVDLLPSISEQTTARRVVLANRYRVTSTTDGNWYSRRHIAGQMIVDPSQLAALAGGGVLTPDNFRQAAFLSIPTGFKRESIQATVSSDNTTLDYSYVDQETPLALGLASKATKIEGSMAAGIASPMTGLSGVTALLTAGASKAAEWAVHSSGGRLLIGTGLSMLGPLGPAALVGTLAGPFLRDPGGSIANAAALVSGVGLPKITGTGIVRLWGHRGATKADLASLGINILMDRFPQAAFGAYASTNGPRIGTISVTQDLIERYVEVNISFMATYIAQISALFGMAPSVISLMNMGTDVVTAGAPGQLPQNTLAVNPLDGSIGAINPIPLASGGTRGDWLGALLVSLLGQPGIPPVNAAVDPAVNVDVPAFI